MLPGGLCAAAAQGKMPTMRTALPVLLTSLLACGPAARGPLPAASVGPSAEHLPADTPKAMAGGTTFTAPAGWSYLERDGVAILETPEPDSHIAVVESAAADAEAVFPIASNGKALTMPSGRAWSPRQAALAGW